MKKFKFLPLVALGALALSACSMPEVDRKTAEVRMKNIVTALENNEIETPRAFAYRAYNEAKTTETYSKLDVATTFETTLGVNVDQRNAFTTMETVITTNGTAVKSGASAMIWLEEVDGQSYLFTANRSYEGEKVETKSYTKVKMTVEQFENQYQDKEIKERIKLSLKEACDAIEDMIKNSDESIEDKLNSELNDENSSIKYSTRFGSTGEGALQVENNLDLNSKYKDAEHTNNLEAKLSLKYYGNTKINNYLLDCMESRLTVGMSYESKLDLQLSQMSLIEHTGNHFQKPNLDEYTFVPTLG